MKSRTDKRLDDIERNLTPRQWAIRWADEIRRHPSELELNKSIAKGPSGDESPFAKPFLALMEQAQDRHPGRSPEDASARRQQSSRLRQDYKGLISLIDIANEQTKEISERNRQTLITLATQLDNLILRDLLEVEEAECRPDPMESDQLAAAARSRNSALLASGWADDAAACLKGFFICKASVEVVQKVYFNGHAILYPDVEEKLNSGTAVILEVIATFNEYVKGKVSGFTQCLVQPLESSDASTDNAVWTREVRRWSCLPLEVDDIRRHADDLSNDAQLSDWKRFARHKAKALILRGTSKYEDFLWESLGRQYGADEKEKEKEKGKDKDQDKNQDKNRDRDRDRDKDKDKDKGNGDGNGDGNDKSSPPS